MFKCKFYLDELARNSTMKINYLAGKQSNSKEEYFRLHVCEADLEFLFNLLIQASSRIYSRFFPFISTVNISDGSIEMLLNLSECRQEGIEETVSWQLKDLLTALVVEEWEKVVGLQTSGNVSSDLFASLESNIKLLKPYKPLKTRRIPPL